MQVDFKQINNVRREISIRIDAATIGKDWEKYLQKSAKNLDAPGFRKGKAPLSMIKRMYGEALEERFHEEMVNKYFEAASQEYKIEHLIFPQVKELNWKENEDMVILIEIEHEPEVIFAQLENLRVPCNFVSLETEVDKYIDDLVKENGRILDVEVSSEGDRVEVEVSFTHAGQEHILNGNLNAGKDQDLTSHDDLIGKKTGDVLDIELAGNLLVIFSQGQLHDLDAETMYPVKLMVNSVSRVVYPEINDDFARDLEFESLEQMRQKISTEMQLKNEHKNIEIQNNSIIAKLYLDNQFELPMRTINYLAERETEQSLGDAYKDYYEYFLNQYRMQISQDLIRYYIQKALQKQFETELTDEMKTEFNRHNAILRDMSLEAYEEKNKEEIDTEDYLEGAKSFYNLRKIAETAEFHLPEPEADRLMEESELAAAEDAELIDMTDSEPDPAAKEQSETDAGHGETD